MRLTKKRDEDETSESLDRKKGWREGREGKGRKGKGKRGDMEEERKDYVMSFK